MSQPVPPPGTFVLRRSPDLEVRARRALSRSLVTQVVTAVVVALLGGVGVVGAVTRWPVPWIGLIVIVGGMLGLMAVSLRQTVRWRRVERGLAGMELWIAPEGLTYVCVAGVFPAPWSALRRMYFGGRPGGKPGAPALFVEVDGWGGPLAEFATGGKPCSLRMPLAGLGADQATIARAVHELSSGQAAVAPR